MHLAVARKSFHELLGGPFHSRVCGHGEMDRASALVPEDYEHESETKRNGRNQKEVRADTKSVEWWLKEVAVRRFLRVPPTSKFPTLYRCFNFVAGAVKNEFFKLLKRSQRCWHEGILPGMCGRGDYLWHKCMPSVEHQHRILWTTAKGACSLFPCTHSRKEQIRD